uniref:Uncharacterized protein n=1 Tax=Siphoviridae sp. ctedO8 TaxID=2827907 RepID=A0A8S5T3T5_9CAUD|nr:MAG TPA: hypothetical protein [Siphoviridae sp. ctedO8]
MTGIVPVSESIEKRSQDGRLPAQKLMPRTNTQSEDKSQK